MFSIGVVLALLGCVHSYSYFIGTETTSHNSPHLSSSRVPRKLTSHSASTFFFGDQKQEQAHIADAILAQAINGIVRLSIGAFGRNDVKVGITSSSNVDALWGRWKRLDVQVGQNVGRWIRVKSARASGKDLDLGIGLTRSIAFIISVLTGTCWTFLFLYFVMSLRGDALQKMGDARKPCAVDWAMVLSADGVKNSSLLRPFFQIILDTLMQNSVLVAALRSSRSDLASAPAAATFKLRSVGLVDRGLEFSADALFNAQGSSSSSSSRSGSGSSKNLELGDMTLAFTVKTSVGVEKASSLEAMLLEGSGSSVPARTLVFRDPSIKADFTETVNALVETSGAVAGFIAKRIPRVMYFPVGAGLGVPLPSHVDKVAVVRCIDGGEGGGRVEEQELQVSGRCEFNQRKVSDQLSELSALLGLPGPRQR